MHGVGDERAEGDDAAGADGLRETDDLAAVGAPLEVGLDADHEDGGGRGGAAGEGEELVGGPRHLALVAVDDADLGAGVGEGVVVLGVHLGEGGGLPGVDEVADSVGGGLAGVVPAAEGGDDVRVFELGELFDVHGISVARGRWMVDRWIGG